MKSTPDATTVQEMHESLVFSTEVFDNENYQVNIPSSYELHVIDKKTGQIVEIFEQATDYELCDGISLTIPAKEYEAWKNETAIAKKLNQQQNKILKTVLAKIGSEKPLTRKEIVAFIEDIQKTKKVPKYRQSGHLIDEKLKYSKPNETLTIFDIISPLTKEKIEESKIEVKAEGIKLTRPENNMVHALNRILYEKSQTKDSKAKDFYGGNDPSKLEENKERKTVILRFRPSELYKAYIGKDDYSGADITFINNTLHQLEAKKVLIKYDRIKKCKNENNKLTTTTDRVEEFQSLIKIIKFLPNLTNEEIEKLDKGDNSIRDAKVEIIIALNPIFTDQIDTKFIEYPIDTNRRLIIAAGGHNKVTTSMHILMDWMLRDLSAKRYKTEINEENLPYILGLEKYVKQKRKKLLQERIEKDIQTMINIGIVLEVEKKPNTTGGRKWIFHLNTDYN